MHLLVIYILVVIIGEVIVFPIGLLIERTLPAFGMVSYMALFFGVLWGGWSLAVLITDKFFPTRGVAARETARP